MIFKFKSVAARHYLRSAARQQLLFWMFCISSLVERERPACEHVRKLTCNSERSRTQLLPRLFIIRMK